MRRVADACTLDDGGMGSLLFLSGAEDRWYDRTISEAWFMDSEGTPIIVSLNVDRDGNLFELDSWKVDFSAMNRLPADAGELLYGPAAMD